MLNLIRSYFARRAVKRRFGDYVDMGLGKCTNTSAGQRVAGPAEVELTPFFASIHSYVSLAEQLPLHQLSEVMNAYYQACGAAIEDEAGVIDKFIGDTVVAMFGAPSLDPDHAMHACVAALRCQASVGALRERWRRDEAQWPESVQGLRVRIGLHTGVAMVGNLGTVTRFSHSMMGDNVNLAAQMERGAKSYGVWTLCTGSTKNACEESAKGRIVFRQLGRIVVKGRIEPVEVFEPMSVRVDASAQMCECVDVFEAGLARWRERDWEGSIRLFEKSAKLERDQPGSLPGISLNPSIMYLELARSYHANPGTGPLFV